MRSNLIWILIGAVVVGWVWSAGQQAQGTLKEQLRVADSLHTAAVVAHRQASDSARIARLQADTLRAAARREARRDAIAEAKTDSALKSSSEERERAETILADSLSSLAELRGGLDRLVRRSAADSSAAANERQQHQRTVARFVVALQQDSLALDKSVAAEKAAILRAVAAEHQTEILRKQMPSQIGGILRTGATVGLTLAVVKLLK